MKRISVTEYGSPVNGIDSIANELGLRPTELKSMLLQKGNEIAHMLNLNEQPIQIVNDTLRIIKIAGILAVGSNLEIEIAPKFLGTDSENIFWREDFFFMAILSKYGRVLDRDRIRAELDKDNGLNIILAKIIIEMYQNNSHRPIRTYNKRIFEDYSIDGECEPESIVFPSENGYEQYEISYRKQNKYNSVIRSAISQISYDVKDITVRSQLDRIMHDLGEQALYNKHSIRKVVPNRNIKWQGLYSLCIDILMGSGLALKRGQLSSLGYAMDTWRVWEDFLNITMGIGFGNRLLRTQFSHTLGQRYHMENNKIISITKAQVRPDIIVLDSNSGHYKFILDAKYKGNIEKSKNRISEEDLYEAMAFALSTKCNKVFLAYPSNPVKGAQLGDINIFEKLVIDQIIVIGIEINIMGISERNGFAKFIHTSKKNLEHLVGTV